jgi:hypothetical protein
MTTSPVTGAYSTGNDQFTIQVYEKAINVERDYVQITVLLAS